MVDLFHAVPVAGLLLLLYPGQLVAVGLVLNSLLETAVRLIREAVPATAHTYITTVGGLIREAVPATA